MGEVDEGFLSCSTASIPSASSYPPVLRHRSLALEKGVAYASERNVFDQPIGAHQGVQHPMAKAHTAVEMASLMTRRAAWEFDNKLPAGASSNMAKYAAAEAGIEAVDAALQAHGGSGFTEDTGLYEMYRLYACCARPREPRAVSQLYRRKSHGPSTVLLIALQSRRTTWNLECAFGGTTPPTK